MSPRSTRWTLALLALAACGPALAATEAATPQQLAQASVAAMGGKAALLRVHSVQLQAHSYLNMLEESERPTGPWIPDFKQTTQWADFAGQRLLSSTTEDSWNPPMTVAVADGVALRLLFPDTPKARRMPGRGSDVDEAQARLALGPERVLLTALAAPDLHREPDVRLQDVPQQVLAFHWHGVPTRIFLNAYTELPTAVELTRAHPYDMFWSGWGDVATRTWYSFWSLQPGGLRYPLQWDIWRNGQPYQTVSIGEVHINGGAPALPAPTAAERAAFLAQKTVDALPLGNAVESLAPGVVVLHNAWNTAVVKQDDGLVIIEAPISTGYTERVLEAAAKRFPGVPIKAVVSTSDAWPHLAGVRAVVARGLPLYIVDLNEPILRRVLEAPHASQPDALTRRPRAPQFHAVSARTVIGSGANRIELYPVRGEAGERMMVAYLPQQRLLYASDLVQPRPDGSFGFPEYLTEVVDVATRERLAVDRVIAMHTPHALPWSALTQAIAKVEQGK